MCLRLIYNDKTTLNEEVLEKDGSVSIYLKKTLEHSQLNYLRWKIASLLRFSYIFLAETGNHKNLRQQNDFLLTSIHKTVYHDGKN